MLAHLTTVAVGCSNFLLAKGAVDDGSTIVTYNADSFLLFGALTHFPRGPHEPWEMVNIFDWDSGMYLGQIPQAPFTYNVIRNTNEWGVSIGESTFEGIPWLASQPGALIDYGSLMVLALQRSTTAREAIQTMGALVAQYGYASSGESFSIGDPDEVWVMEMIGKGNHSLGAVWVARRIPDGYISGHANQARITTFPLNDPSGDTMYAPDVISFARAVGLYPADAPDADFSFSDTYNPVSPVSARICEARVWNAFTIAGVDMSAWTNYALGLDLSHRMPLWVQPPKPLSFAGVHAMVSAHYNNTVMEDDRDVGAGPWSAPYRDRPLVWGYNGREYLNERSVGIQQSGFSFISVHRGWLPVGLRSVQWFAVDDATTAIYIPVYGNASTVPKAYRNDTVAQPGGVMMQFDATKAFWVQNMVANLAYTRWSEMYPIVAAAATAAHADFAKRLAATDQFASRLILSGQPDAAAALVSQFVVDCADSAMAAWWGLYGQLFTQYFDGVVRGVAPGQQMPVMRQAGYPQAWYARIVNETGDRYRLPGTADVEPVRRLAKKGKL